MMSATLRRVSFALAALTLACGDATAPTRLTEAQVGDMLDAMSLVAYSGDTPGTAAMSQSSLRGSSLLASYLQASTQLVNATVSVSQTVSCPNGGSASWNGTATDDPEAGASSAQITQSFSNCAATSSEGRVWTFNGDPSIVTNVSSTYNEATGAFSLNMTQIGGIRFSSDLGAGGCQISLTVTMSGDADSFSATLNGSACGHTIEQSIEATQ
jgi:hypothetical protein